MKRRDKELEMGPTAARDGGRHAGWSRRHAGILVAIALLTFLALGCAAPERNAPAGRKAVIDRILASSTKVTLERGSRRVASGSGVVIASEERGPGSRPVSYVLTAAHIFEGKADAMIFVHFTGESALRGKLAASIVRRAKAQDLDLVLLQVTGVAVPPAPLAEDDQVQLGENILVVGFPWGRRVALFSGIVSQIPADGNEERAPDDSAHPAIMVDAAVGNGVSGGGVFRESTGTLLGVVEGYQTASIAVKDRSRTYSLKVPMPGETYVVPITRIRSFLLESGVKTFPGNAAEGKAGKD